jgi:putative FmdB family regulatory protein
MPIYEYFCDKCNKKFEQLRPVSKAGEDSECPTCHSKAKKVLSMFSAYSNYAPGLSNPLAGSNSCGSCSSSSCSTCGH